MGHSILRDPLQAKSALGIVLQDIALYEDPSARENQTFWGTMYNLFGKALSEWVDEVLQIIGLTERQKHKVGPSLRIQVWIAWAYIFCPPCAEGQVTSCRHLCLTGGHRQTI